MDTPHGPGLTSAEAAVRLKRYGQNSVVTKRKFRPLVAFLRKFNSPLLWIIILASILSLFIGERIDAGILMLMTLVSVVLDYVNSSRSEKAVNSLVGAVITTVTVRRDGGRHEIPLAHVVPGDIVTLTSGDVIPADGQLLEVKDFFVNQSTLNGESLPVEKRSRLARSEELHMEDPAAVFMGTSVVTGYATMEVLRTGAQTHYGKIAERLLENEPLTDFERGIRSFSLFLMRVTIVMVVAVFVLNATAHHGWLNSLIFAIAIAIGLTPELLPVILTVSLSRGAVQMSKKHVIVKHLPAIQNFGRMTVLCTDKTGTLTENKISVVKYVDGLGKKDDEVLRQAFFSSYFHSGVYNPLDDAIRDYRSWPLEGIKKIDEIPFDFERRRESIVVEEHGQRLLVTKGAPEALLSIVDRFRRATSDVPMTEELQRSAAATFTQLSAEGYRVLAVASRSIRADEFPYKPDDERGMVFMGFIALLDPPKSGVRETVCEMSDLGVEIKILTGDTLVLTEKICRDIQLPVRGTISGSELAKLRDEEWPAMVTTTTIFARIDPEQKERIITELSKTGNVVGHMGDGINDAPALKAADVGISVNNAVDVAKETADIILLKHSLAVLKDGILEGRKTFHNTMKYIMMGLSSNFGNMVSMTGASAFLPFLPMLPTQILLNNFLYDTSQLALSTDDVDGQDLTKPTIWDIRFIQRFMYIFGPISSLFDFLTFGVLLWVFKLTETGFQTGWFIESIATQVFVIYVIRTKRLPFIQSRPSLALMLNTLLAVSIAWLIPYLPLHRWFNLEPLPVSIVVAIFGIVVIYLLMVEFLKRWFYRYWQRQLAKTHA